MQMTREARVWLDATVKRILARHQLGDAERMGITYELMSHLHGAGETHAVAAGRTEVGPEDLETALAESGGEQGLGDAFVKPLAKPEQRVLFARRLGAFLIDFSILAIALSALHGGLALLLRPLAGGSADAFHARRVFILFPEAFHDPTLSLVAQAVIAAASVGLVLGYFTLLEGHDGRSLGKRALDLRVVREDGQPMTYRAAFGRNLAKAAPLLFLGDTLAMLLFFRKDCQRPSDKLAKTIVVR